MTALGIHPREFWSHDCQQDQHQPACDGYYPPGPDTYTCHCPCHNQRRGGTEKPKEDQCV